MTAAPARILWLSLYATAMGWLEAVVVVYLRAIVGLAHGAPMPPYDEVMRRLRAIPWLLPVEWSREVSTLVMLVAVAWLAADRLARRFGALLLIFGTWDIAYYLGLRLLVGWPTRLDALDLLFLIPPHPWWYQPIWVPIAISMVMIVVGTRLLADDAEPGRAPRELEGTRRRTRG